MKCHHGVVVEDLANARRRRLLIEDHPFGLRHLVIDPADHRREFEGQPSRADEHVGLAGAERLPFHAETGEVEAARRRSHELDGAARRAERHGPQGVGPRPVDQIVEAREQPIRVLTRYSRSRDDVLHQVPSPTGTPRAAIRRCNLQRGLAEIRASRRAGTPWSVPRQPYWVRRSRSRSCPTGSGTPLRCRTK